jgi:hypothetical protein
MGNARVQPVMEKLGLKWWGWHACRRGTASNLLELGADDLTVLRVLRHSKVQVTREPYIKVGDPKFDAAMRLIGQHMATWPFRSLLNPMLAVQVG